MCISACVVGGGSASKEHNKKRVAENKELPNIEILAFSPERRLVGLLVGWTLRWK